MEHLKKGNNSRTYMFPPRDSSDSSISLDVLELVDYFHRQLRVQCEEFRAYFESQPVHYVADTT